MIVKHKRGKTADLEALNPIFADGELVVEICSDGTRKCKIGDGKTVFTKLSYIDTHIEALLLEKIDTAKADLYKKIDEIAAALSIALSGVKQDTAQDISNSVSLLTSDYIKRDAALANVFNEDLNALESVLREDLTLHNGVQSYIKNQKLQSFR